MHKKIKKSLVCLIKVSYCKRSWLSSYSKVSCCAKRACTSTKSIETLLEITLATAKSNIVSPLKSPTATERGPIPTSKLVAVPNNEPVPVPKSIETLLELG